VNEPEIKFQAQQTRETTMNLTVGRSIPVARRLVSLQHLALAAGLSTVVTAAVVIGWQAAGSSSRQPEPATVPASVRQPSAIPATLYIVESRAQADALISAANEGLGGPIDAIVASGPGVDEHLALLFAEDANGMLPNVRIVDTRNR
jgi:hypothetical protein